MESTQQVEGIVLQAIPYKDYDRILTLFAPTGILKFFVKIRKRDYLHFAALTSPWTRVELQYALGRKDLHRVQEGTILAQHLRLRDSFANLTAADTMSQALLRSQWQGKAAPQLYSLFRLFLEHLPHSAAPHTYASAFLIKMLAHEGMLQLSKPQQTYRYGGEQYSASHAPPGHLTFSADEEHVLFQLAVSRSLSHIGALTLHAELHTKIGTLFSQVFGS